ncbi:MAG: cell division protein FtsQ/DivIB [Candidatus Nealsonbacteria bacterium]|nr:cell division protein FtsQ/DivIB [Candidatus Nealsonbacteria bacterium]
MKKIKYYGKFNKYRSRRKRKIFYFIPVLLFFTIFYLIYFSPFFQIKKIEISGNQKISSDNLKGPIEDKLIKKILFFNSKSLFLADLKEIEESILKKYPEIEKVNFFKKIPDKLMVLIKERSPVAVLEKDNNYFLIDKSGIVFEKTEEKQNFLLIKKPEFTQEIKLGNNLIEEEWMGQILKVEPEFKNKNLEFRIDFAEILNEQRLNVKTSEGFEVYFDLLGDISQQVLNLSVILKEKISPKELRNLEYIDLRFGNQVYYK